MGPVIFAFGPGDRYMVSNGNRSWWNDLPGQLNEAIGVEARNVDAFLACSFGPDDQHFVTFRQRGGKITQRRHQLPPKLNDWLYKNARYTRNLETLRVVLGPNDSFFAMDKNGLRWDKLPDKLETILQESLTLEGWKAAPKAVALGVDGAFVLVDWKGNIHRELLGKYEDLEKYLNNPNIGRDIEYLSLDGFRGKYYFVKKKGGRRYWTPSILEKLMPDFVRQLTDNATTPPASIESVLSEKRAVEASLAAEKRAAEKELADQRAQYKDLQTSHKDVETRLKAIRKDLIERKREWKESLDAQTKELTAIKTATTNAAARAIAMTNERVAHDSMLRQQLQAAQQTNDAHNKAMMELNNQFIELMNTVSSPK